MAIKKRILLNFHENLHYPKSSDEIQVLKEFPTIMHLTLSKLSDKDKHFNSVSRFIDSIDYGNWLIRLSNRLNEIRFTYVLLAFSYKTGIPDKKWVRESEDGKSEFFTNSLTEKQYVNNFLFGYYAEYFFYQIFSSFDILNKCIDKLYSFNTICSPMHFNKKVLDSLKIADTELHNEMILFLNNTKSFRNIRNAFTHDFPINKIDLRSKKKNDKASTITLNDPAYTPSERVLDKIHQLVELYLPLIKLFQSKMEFKDDNKEIS